MTALVIGVDPGLSTGVLSMVIDEGVMRQPIAVQIHGHECVVPLVQALLNRHPQLEQILAVEQFVVGPRSVRSSTPEGGRVTRSLIGALTNLNVHASYVRAAAVVKPWASNTRLEAAGLIGPTEGMQHARDAARHALYAAVSAHLLFDPMSAGLPR